MHQPSRALTSHARPCAIRMLRKARKTKRSDMSDKREPVTNVSFRKTRAFPAATMASRQNNNARSCAFAERISKARAIITSISGRRQNSRWLLPFDLSATSGLQSRDTDVETGGGTRGYTKSFRRVPGTINLYAFRRRFYGRGGGDGI